MGGVTYPAGQVEPYKFTLAMAQAAEKLGAEIVQGEVVGFATAGDKISGVQLASGNELQADSVVLAMGPWTGQGSALLGCEMGCRAVFTECLRAKMPIELPLHALAAGDYWILPKKNGEVILAWYGPDDFVERIYEKKIVLLRPDQHVAWRGDECPEDPHRVVDRIRGGLS